MVGYRRNLLPGGTFFFTVTLRDRHSSLLVDHIHLLRRAVKQTRASHPFTIDAVVVLPEHIHAIWTLPKGDTDYSLRWRLIKSHFTRLLRNNGSHCSRNHKGEANIWQRRFWEHTIRDERDYRNHVDYIHYNPVKHGHVSHVIDWPYSSFQQYVAKGIIEPDWGVAQTDTLIVGESHSLD